MYNVPKNNRSPFEVHLTEFVYINQTNYMYVYSSSDFFWYISLLKILNISINNNTSHFHNNNNNNNKARPWLELD